MRRALIQRPPEATVNHDAPSAELLATLGVLRRPVGPDDAYPGGRLRGEDRAGAEVIA